MTEDFAGRMPVRVVLAAVVLLLGMVEVPRRASGVATRSWSLEAPAFVGSWEGVLQTGAAPLRLVLHVSLGSNARDLEATLDSPDQGQYAIPCTSVEGDPATGYVVRIELIGAEIRAKIREGGNGLDATFHQSGVQLDFPCERVEESTLAARPQTPKPPYPYRAIDVTVESEGATLAGSLTLPGKSAGSDRVPAVILVAGIKRDRDGSVVRHEPQRVLADHLTRAGYAVLRLDDRGVGESTGDLESATMADRAVDLLAARRFLAARSGIRADRIGLVGHGDGGNIAALAAAGKDAFAFVVMLNSLGRPGHEVLLRQQLDLAKVAGRPTAEIRAMERIQRRIYGVLLAEDDPDRAREKLMAELRGDPLFVMRDRSVIEAQVEKATTPVYRSFVRHDPALALARVRCPVLVLHGEHDLEVAPSENLEAIRGALHKGGNARVTAEVLADVNHLLQTCEDGAPSRYASIEETYAVAALLRIEAWITATLRSDTGGAGPIRAER